MMLDCQSIVLLLMRRRCVVEVIDAAKNMAEMEAEFERKREEILCGQI